MMFVCSWGTPKENTPFGRERLNVFGEAQGTTTCAPQLFCFFFIFSSVHWRDVEVNGWIALVSAWFTLSSGMCIFFQKDTKTSIPCPNQRKGKLTPVTGILLVAVVG